ncbi:MAG: hypothetical protein ACU4F9_04205 [Arcticibacter sp.]
MKNNFFTLLASLCFTMNIAPVKSQTIGNTVNEVTEKFLEQDIGFMYTSDDSFYYVFENNEAAGTERQFVFDKESRRCVTVFVRILNEDAMASYIEILNDNKNLMVKERDRVWQSQENLYGSMSFRLVKRKDFKSRSNDNIVAVLKISWAGSVFDQDRF